MDWLMFSIVASLVLTVVLNVALRVFPGAGDRLARRMEAAALAEPAAPDDPYVDPYAPPLRQRRVKMFFPWKAMLVGSIVMTVLLNLVLRLG